MDELLLLAGTEQEPVDRHRRDQQCARPRGAQERDDVQLALELRRLLEPRRERHREEKGEQDLHAGLGDAQLLQQLAQVAVQPLCLRLASRSRVVLLVGPHARAQ
jgi:hypothetical protein